MGQEQDTGRGSLPDRELTEGALRYVPLLETYFRSAHAEMPKQLRDLFQNQGLTARHGAVLAQLVHGQEATVGELAKHLGVGMPRMSELVGDLAQVGLVERRRDPANRRRVLVSLAPEHIGMMRELVSNRAKPLLRALDSLTPAQREGFAAGLKAWAHELHR